MFADIVGYTSVMQRNENEGEVIQFLGEGSLCIFHSAIHAIEAEKSIQHPDLYLHKNL